MQAEVVTNLLKGPGIHKRGNAVDPGPQPDPRETGGDRNHILFRDTGVDEARPQRIAERLQRLIAEIAGQEHEIGVGGPVYEGSAEDIAHRSVTSRTACSYKGAVRGK